MMHSIRTNPRRFLQVAGGFTLLLVCQSFVTEAILETLVGGASETVPGLLLDLFSVNLEESIPTWYSTLLLFIAAVLLMLFARVRHQEKSKFRWHWTGLAGIFLYLSMDEGAAIHEIATDPLQVLFNTSGYLTFAWLLLAIPLLLLFGLIYLRFWWQLPALTRRRFFIAAVIYVSGAVVVEAISANQYAQSGITLPYLAIATLEEGCEMLGIVFFIFAVLDEMRLRGDSFALQSVASEDMSEDMEEKPHFRASPVAIIIGLLALNVLLTVWLVSVNAPENVLEDVTDYSQIIASMQAAGVSIHYLPGDAFIQNPEAQDIAGRLLAVFDEMMLLTLSNADLNIIFAADDLPYGTDTMRILLERAGEQGFVLFDTVAIRAFTGITP